LDKVTRDGLKGSMGNKLATEAVEKNRLKWLGHVLRKDDSKWVERGMFYAVYGVRVRGSPR